MELLTNPETWVALLTLTVLEIVLGIDNVIFISILVQRLPLADRDRARIIGLGLAMGMRILLLLTISWIAGAEKVGHHKTSMLQDVEAGRDLEIDALLGAVVELARLTETPTPHLDTVYSLTKLLAKSLQESRMS